MTENFSLDEQRQKARQFFEAHRAPQVLVLANAWDAASAKMFEVCGFRAVATTSAGVANSYGYPDGEKMSRAETLDVVRRIARAVDVPVTADMEAGFGSTSDEVAETARLVLEAGAVGLNLEDGTDDDARPLLAIDEQVERIKAVKRAAENFGVPLLLNARVDVYEKFGADVNDRLAQTVERAKAYLEAGADCVFPIAMDDKDEIAELVRATNNAPINILARHGSLPVSALEKLGVARISFGSIPMRATMATVKQIAQEIQERGTYNFAQGIPTYTELNNYFKK
ncbi:MAG: isocitrate lyase/phosphoenolpyruvate mutase family protein [Anaerolineales bacterium]|nr:isocitrate lyase/phosphoenolpyruvate mutase family protein [Anaerolineales bacterium]